MDQAGQKHETVEDTVEYNRSFRVYGHILCKINQNNTSQSMITAYRSRASLCPPSLLIQVNRVSIDTQDPDKFHGILGYDCRAKRSTMVEFELTKQSTIPDIEFSSSRIWSVICMLRQNLPSSRPSLEEDIWVCCPGDNAVKKQASIGWFAQPLDR